MSDDDDEFDPWEDIDCHEGGNNHCPYCDDWCCICEIWTLTDAEQRELEAMGGVITD